MPAKTFCYWNGSILKIIDLSVWKLLNILSACLYKYSRGMVVFVQTFEFLLLSGSLANSNIRNKHILTSHKHELILLPGPFSKYVYAYVK